MFGKLKKLNEQVMVITGGKPLTINSGATLEFTTDLTPPVVWSELDAPSVPTNGMMGVNLSITNNSQFYRLKLP